MYFYLDALKTYLSSNFKNIELWIIFSKMQPLDDWLIGRIVKAHSTLFKKALFRSKTRSRLAVDCQLDKFYAF